MKMILLDASASSSESVSSPGTPNTCSTPSFSRHLTSRSAARCISALGFEKGNPLVRSRVYPVMHIRHAECLNWRRKQRSIPGGMPMALQSINPATEEVLATFEEFSSNQLDQALDRAAQAFDGWHRV